MVAIINRGEQFGQLGSEIKKNTEVQTEILKAIKLGKATLIVDNDNTLAYKLLE